MNAQQLANVVIEILPKVNIPMSPENIAAAGQLYNTLGQMARGELILMPASPVPFAAPPKE